jgi:UDP-N-acetylglucosamine--N-acetylmuramyl-(pentapeptide) pyrophosphoryl-undecaprenol N-acetylglucosamine transferase
MKIVVTGGGSGGHITPVLAVAHELKKLRPEVEICYIGQRGDSLGDIPAEDPSIDRAYAVRAGKFRRYHGEGLKQLLDLKTTVKNLRDAIYVVVGIWQSIRLLGRIKPTVVFIKGGFVGVPVGFAAALRGIPYITHDSDAMPGLANRLVAPWARIHAVALPKEVYNYPADKTVTVGVPIAHHFHPLTVQESKDYRKYLGLEDAEQILLVTGGGLGAQRMNDAVTTCMSELLVRYPGLYVVHIAGRPHEAGVRQYYKQNLAPKVQPRVQVKGHVTNLYQYSGVADVVLTRAGATAMAEFAAQRKACVVVPNPLLAGGHQLKNAQVLTDRKAIRMVSEAHLHADHHALMPPLTDLFDHPEKIKSLGQKLASVAQPNAAHLLAMLLLEAAESVENTNSHNEANVQQEKRNT